MKLSVITTVAILAAAPLTGIARAQSPTASQAQPSDQELSATIATRIANDKSLAADAVKVTVEGGVVTLTGVVPKEAGKLKAEQLARVPGVVRVENKLVSREKAADKTKETAGVVADKTKETAGVVADKTKEAAGVVADKSKKGAEKTKDALSKTGEVITDSWISTRIKAKFMADDALNASDIKVDASDHVVTLNGTVPTAAAHTKAIALAKEVEGVKRVVDHVHVAAKTP